MEPSIEARSLFKNFDSVSAVAGISFEVSKGECFGIFGPEGAGKTSTVNMLNGGSPLSSGDLFLFGQSVKGNESRLKLKIGLLPQQDSLDSEFSVWENLLVFSNYFGIPKKRAALRIRELLRQLRIDELSEELVSNLGIEERRSLSLVRAMLHKPELLLLDEPTENLEKSDREFMWNILKDLKSSGVCLLLTTKNMDEALQLCDRVVLMDKGVFLVEGKPQELIEKYIGKEVVEFLISHSDLEYYVRKVKKNFEYQIINNSLRVFIKTGQDGREAMNLVASNKILVRPSTLQDVFLKVAGHEMKKSQHDG